MKPPTLAAGYTFLIPVLIEAGRRCGYAIGVHGTMARDLDLIAAPWTEEATDAETLVKALSQEIGGWVATRARPSEGAEPEDLPRERPHGRRAWLIYLNGGVYLDLSVMPRTRFPDGR